MELNLQNIEEVIFFDKKVQTVLPEFRHLFDQWSLSKRVPGLQTLGKRTIIELLNSLKPDHIRKLEEYFGCIIILDKIDGHIVKNHEGNIEEIDKDLCRFSGYADFSLYRDGEKAYITYWR